MLHHWLGLDANELTLPQIEGYVNQIGRIIEQCTGNTTHRSIVEHAREAKERHRLELRRWLTGT